MPEKGQNQNKLATVHFTTYYPSTNYTFTKRHPSIKNYVPSYSKWLSQKCQKKSQKQNKLATVHFTAYYTSTNYTLTKRHSSIKNYVPSYSKSLSQKCQKKAKNETNLQQCISIHITLPQIITLQNDNPRLSLIQKTKELIHIKKDRKPVE